ncbi:hypothetical protein [Sphingobacterium humi]|uniref:Phosphoenolpyruvate carboxykinase n=1 Tax=Sphingobacterium humi TaxID=1796905 RepID=A0A6N8L5E8_9SPHI|nr:hypothetical protein [Sphingobacterium humi]MVZ63661.1 hypothetical protein [Sphingobacterium humi]
MDIVIINKNILSKKMNITYYHIAELLLAVKAPEKMDVRAILPSFHPFYAHDIERETAHISIELTFSPCPTLAEDAVLLTDESITWGENFRFYECADTYQAIIYVGSEENKWVMECSKDFQNSTIYLAIDDRNLISNLCTWYTMMAFGQAALAFDTILIHASVVQVDRFAYAFLGKSGTGKSTHSQLWLSAIKGALLLNDDNPAVRIRGEKVEVFGTPWSGKKKCYLARKAQLRAFVRLEQAPFNQFKEVLGMEAFLEVVPSCTSIRWNRELFHKMNDTLEAILKKVKVGRLKCLPNIRAAELSYIESSKSALD